MANKLPVKSTVLYGDEDRRRAKVDRTCETKKVITLKELVAPQTVPLFIISYELLTNERHRS
jgi:hypothetical protein